MNTENQKEYSDADKIAALIIERDAWMDLCGQVQEWYTAYRRRNPETTEPMPTSKSLGTVIAVGGGIITVLVDRDLMSYPQVGTPVFLGE